MRTVSGRLRQIEALLPELTAIYAGREGGGPLPRVLYRRLVSNSSRTSLCGMSSVGIFFLRERALLGTETTITCGRGGHGRATHSGLLDECMLIST